ncbi:MAG: serine protein kinase RIO [Candidatus Hadarchaeales archaeon]
MPSDIDSLLRRLERRKPERLEKDSEIFKIMERVFDTATLLALYRMINRGVIDVFYGAVSTGKESNVFCAIDRSGNYVAVKIYRVATSNFKSMRRYLIGDPRFREVPNDRREVVYAWATREFKNLQKASEAGVPVPRPIDCENNVLAMEFVGEEGVPYPRMKDVSPENPSGTFEVLVKAVGTMYSEAELVHSDLSEYNVLLTPDPVIIDLSMGTDVRSPMAREYLRRDVENLARYFSRLGVSVPDPVSLIEKITGGCPGTR